jgi:hypothetical protein
MTQCVSESWSGRSPAPLRHGLDLLATDGHPRTAPGDDIGGRSEAKLPDAHEIAHETICDPARQGSTRQHRETAKPQLKHATVGLRLRGEKDAERLRA